MEDENISSEKKETETNNKKSLEQISGAHQVPMSKSQVPAAVSKESHTEEGKNMAKQYKMNK